MKKEAKIPDNYQRVMPYLILMDAVKFIGFASEVFNATPTYKAMKDENSIMHGEIMIGESTIMFADATDAYKASPAGLFVYVDDADATYQKALGAGAEIVTGLSDQPYGRSGGVKDPFGNTWWITSVS